MHTDRGVMGGITHCHSNCHLAKFRDQWHDVPGEIRRCDWQKNSRFGMSFQVIGFE